MFNFRPVLIGLGSITFVVSTFTALPMALAADKVPASVAALLPKGAKLGKGDWAVMPTEFGNTFGGDFDAREFPGKSPSCDLAGTTKISISLTGNPAFDQPPMLDMFVQEFEQNLKQAIGPLKTIEKTYAKEPQVVAVGKVKEVNRSNGHLFYIQYQEDCRPHPKGYKTQLRGLAHRGATRLDFTLWLALDEKATLAIADEILANFEKLDIAALSK